jgi:hypothetical protein
MVHPEQHCCVQSDLAGVIEGQPLPCQRQNRRWPVILTSGTPPLKQSVIGEAAVELACADRAAGVGTDIHLLDFGTS